MSGWQAAIERIGVTLSEQQRLRCELYLDELLRWNQRINLVGFRDPQQVGIEAIADSLAILHVIPHGWRTKRLAVIDVGSGGGIPGVALQIACPSWEVTLVEASQKKATFLSSLTRIDGLNRLNVVCRRAESLAHDTGYREQFDLAVCRAVAPLPVALELVSAFLKVGGKFIAQQGTESLKRLSQLTGIVNQLAVRLVQRHQYQLLPTTAERTMVLFEKSDHTPSRFPRPPGVPQKRPLHPDAPPPR
ncbi:MAG: 16S rRNA (guanine(527)-N(7))-methyltransferase RsmG [Elusimicrobia bacterium]|nr:16S rRNA (guanine(527)-N(7))-methyltransferase RsmG [Elusimicrobiota bacterium]